VCTLETLSGGFWAVCSANDAYVQVTSMNQVSAGQQQSAVVGRYRRFWDARGARASIMRRTSSCSIPLPAGLKRVGHLGSGYLTARL